MSVSTSYNHSLGKIFSSSLLSAFISENKIKLSNLSSELIRSGVARRKNVTFGTALTACFDHLKSEYRTEYVYKESILSKLVLANHKLSECVIIPEFRTGLSKADLAVFNGTSTVYEIKTELDNLERLEGQLSDYNQIFDYVYVVTTSKYSDKILDFAPLNVGVYVFGDDGELALLKDASSNKKCVNPSLLMASLRKEEYQDIVLSEFGFLPEVPSTKIYGKCLEMIQQINPSKLHDLMVSCISQRKLSDFQMKALEKVPPYILPLWISKKYSEKQCKLILQGLKYKLNEFEL